MRGVSTTLRTIHPLRKCLRKSSNVVNKSPKDLYLKLYIFQDVNSRYEFIQERRNGITVYYRIQFLQLHCVYICIPSQLSVSDTIIDNMKE